MCQGEVKHTLDVQPEPFRIKHGQPQHPLGTMDDVAVWLRIAQQIGHFVRAFANQPLGIDGKPAAALCRTLS